MDISKLAKAYIAIRDKRSEFKKAWEAQDDDLKAKLTLLDGQILKFLQDNKLDSSATEFGTVYRQEEVKAGAADWDVYWSWLKEQDTLEGLEKRVAQGFIKKYIEDHDGDIPPGVSVYREYVARVRRA